MNNWKNIWESKVVIKDKSVLMSLIRADGFDTGFGTYDEESWNKMVLDFIKKANIKNNSSVLEIGCGAGAFLYSLHNNLDIDIYGLDYSNSLIQEAKKNIPDGLFYCNEATSLDFKHKQFDLIFSHSVFQYFESIDYAFSVCQKAFDQLKINGTFAILDINDSDYFEEYHSNRLSSHGTKQEYEYRYSGLDHLFFNRKEMTDMLKHIGFDSIEIYQNYSKKYENSKYRFNIIGKKNSV